MSSDHAGQLQGWQQDFLRRHRLGSDYLETASRWFEPLCEDIVMHHKGAERTIIVGVNGSQGSGKSTLCDYLRASLQHKHALEAVSLSLDDFYLTRAERAELARTVHPLLETRGVPGTHDYALLQDTLKALSAGKASYPVSIPAFDKLLDERVSQSQWQQIERPVDVVLLEGWCLGATAQDEAQLATPANTLEAAEDAQGVWRQYSNRALGDSLLPIYAMIDLWVMLRAPSFDCVFQWRKQQEEKLKLIADESNNNAGTAMTEEQLQRFIAHYERLTRHCLEQLPERVHFLFTLDETRRIVSTRHRQEPKTPC